MIDIEVHLATFRRLYGAAGPLRFASAPGRVNLIGEHIDYAGLPVLPMALEQAVGVLFRPREGERVRVATTEPGTVEADFPAGVVVPAAETGDWSNYVRAAVQAVARRLTGEDRAVAGWDGLVVSDLPIAAGLSSSSALVVAAALATLDASQGAVPIPELAALLARAERYVGTAGGGMDQAVSLGGRPGHAMLVSFDPLRLEPVAVPHGWTFVVAHSLERSEKSGAAQAAYNLRGRQIREALDRLAADAGIEAARRGYPALLREHPVDALLDAADEAMDRTHLARFRHVVTEARRVDHAVSAMRAADADAFGALMDASHASLRDDFEVSTPALDELVELAREAGARGARLTGAGFGGCMVALCGDENAGAVVEALRAGFYRPRGEDVGGATVFVARACGGAEVVEV